MGEKKAYFNILGGILEQKLKGGRAPLYLELFITGKCNLRCEYCFSVNDSIPSKIMNAVFTKEKIFEIIDEFHAMGTRIVSLLGGEPLLHKDLGEITRYISDKGMYLNIFTNGMMVGKRLDDLKPVHALAVSLDGIGEDNDRVRGVGSYEAALTGIREALAAGINCRIHSVLTRHTLHKFREMAELAQSLGVVVSLSPPNFLGEPESDDFRISAEEYKQFYRELLVMKAEGLPIANSIAAIQKCLDWPVDYHRYIANDETFDTYKPEFCICGHQYVALGAGGNMYNCINLGYTNGPNIYEHGVRGAWEKLIDYRPDCYSCASLSFIEASMLAHMRFETMFSGIKFHFKQILPWA